MLIIWLNCFVFTVYPVFCFRMYDICCSTYESASLRMFKYGRTDGIRATTAESAEFVQSMQDPAKTVV